MHLNNNYIDKLVFIVKAKSEISRHCVLKIFTKYRFLSQLLEVAMLILFSCCRWPQSTKKKLIYLATQTNTGVGCPKVFIVFISLSDKNFKNETRIILNKVTNFAPCFHTL